MVTLLNLEYLNKYKSLKASYVKNCLTHLPRNYQKLDISVVFVNRKKIKELNKEFRDIDKPTDVLSFQIDENVNEIYICPEYIYASYRGKMFEEEILRMIVHGVLHIYGLDHKGKFDHLRADSEEMFKVQEDILHKIMKKV
ncbi:MAG TPA: rRNA maturation RNase YbeY [Candidatus Dojkabacteria bacterium]|nr:rRNA maturation RNase YbeY [Candidatus Dojkabacteria bacterium]